MNHFLAFLIPFFINCQLYYSASAQKVNIGEKCPDVKLKLINYSSKEASLLTAFNDKPLIIDFWNTHCAPCIALIPQLDSLQKAYKNQFNVLLVTSEKEEAIKSFLKKNETLKSLKLPIVYAADTIRNMFPHFGEPHDVWIDKAGVVQAITNMYELLPENFEKFIHGNALNLREKKEMLDEETLIGKPLLIVDEEKNSGKNKLYYSWMGTYNPLVPSMTLSDFKIKGARKLICQNFSATVLYKIAYSMYKDNGPIEIIYACKDSLRLIDNNRTGDNRFCFEIYMRDSSETDDKIKTQMQKELDRFFNLKSIIKKENVSKPCYVLTRLKNNENFKNKDNARADRTDKDNNIILKNVPIQGFIASRIYAILSHDMINETGYRGGLDLVLPNTTDVSKIKQSLNQYGLDINLEVRSDNTVVLQDIQ
ncbi:TlpA family protein disulfide reductase [Chitinophaga flava]|nr:TlpA disulfide reductase family protein [Chitinophaga flava]